jgi:benzoate-CoA ligase
VDNPRALDIPRDYNAAEDLLGGNLTTGRAGKTAYIDDSGSCTFGELADRVNRFGNHLLSLGLRMEDRILIAMHDSIDWPVAFLGAIKAGIVPVAVNTLLTPKDYEYMLSDSRAKALLVSPPLKGQFEPFLPKLPFLKHVLVPPFKEILEKSSGNLIAAPTTSDDPCFWLYSSGSTGMPKGTVHVHSSVRRTSEHYAEGILGLKDADVIFSAAKLFFAYGLGNSLTFPLAVGASTVLMAERPTPDAVFKRLTESKPTFFFGVPTLYAGMLAAPAFPSRASLSLRICVSAGEALPPQIAKSFKEKTGIDILDGIGSTEMLHIFLSNRPEEFRPGTTGKAVPGYELRLVDEKGNDVKQGELGELLIKGSTSANLYWNNRAKSRSTFNGEWTRSGDKYSQDADGFYVYGGRTDDMLKVSGIWVSPAEVEAALVSHEAVLEAAVVGKEDEQKLVKPKAFVVLKPGKQASVEDLQAYVKSRLAPYKYPRWIEFAAELPKTATGKIQRFKLRA